MLIILTMIKYFFKKKKRKYRNKSYNKLHLSQAKNKVRPPNH